MKVSIVIDSKLSEPVCEIRTSSVTQELQTVIDAINGASSDVFLIPAWKNDLVTLLKPVDIMRIYSCTKKIFAETEDSTYELKYRLYEIEDMLAEHSLKNFIRISNTDIVNFDFVHNLDMSLSGTICINFKNKSRAFVSRRYVSRICGRLGIK